MTALSPGCHPNQIQIETNSSTREESEIVGDSPQIQTEEPNIAGDRAAKKQKTKHGRGIKATVLDSSEKYRHRMNGNPVETQRFRVEDQGKTIHEFDMYQGVLIDETAVVLSLVDLTNIFEGTYVKIFSRRKEGNTLDSAEVKAWMAELEEIKLIQYAQSAYTADQMRKETQNRVKSIGAHKGGDEIDGPSLFKGTIQMHSDRLYAANNRANGSIVSVLRATANAQDAENGERPMQQTRCEH
jgi:hypothetical protein